jgi:hypothetical protein
MIRQQRGQTAAEYMGVLLLVAVLIAGIATTKPGRRIGDAVGTTICRIAGGDHCGARTRPATATRGDRDGDGIPDAGELALGTDPTEADGDGFDTPGDGLDDAQEIARGTDPNEDDSDGDGYPDGYEVEHGDDPTSDERSLWQKGFETFVLDDPISLVLPSGAAAKFLGKGFERFAVEVKAAYRALREAKTLEQAAAARRKLLGLLRDRLRRAPKPDPEEAAQRKALLEDLARKLERRRVSQQYKARIEELAKDPDQGRVGPGTMLEATDAVLLEQAGKLRRVRRADPSVPRERGADFVDANGRLWDHKQAISGPDFESAEFVHDLELSDMLSGESIILNVAKLTDADRAAVMAEVRARGLTGRFIFIR